MPNEAQLEGIFLAETDRLVEALNGHWNDVQAILAQANLERLSHDKQLFRPLPTPNAVEPTKELVSRTTVVTWFVASFAGMVLGMIAFLMRGMLRNP